MNFNHFKTLGYYFTDNILGKFPSDHKFFEIAQAGDINFFSTLETIFVAIEKHLGQIACSDYVKKLICKSNNNFDGYQYNSVFTELLVLYLILLTLNKQIISADYEPTSKTNSKKTEYKFTTSDGNLNVEVKALNFSESFVPILTQAFKDKCYIYKEFIELNNEERIQIKDKLLREHLDVKLMPQYYSEWRKINKQIKDANKKFNSDEKYNVLFINYNAGLDAKEVLKVVLDPQQGIANSTKNMNNIDAIIVLSLSEKCYSLTEIEHAATNSYIIFNKRRNNREVLDLISVFGDQVFEEDKDLPRWDLYKIVVFLQKQFVIVPYQVDEDEVFKEVITFLAPKGTNIDELLQSIEQNKLIKRYERKI